MSIATKCDGCQTLIPTCTAGSIRIEGELCVEGTGGESIVAGDGDYIDFCNVKCATDYINKATKELLTPK